MMMVKWKVLLQELHLTVVEILRLAPPPRTRIQETSFGGRDYEEEGARPRSEWAITSKRTKLVDFKKRDEEYDYRRTAAEILENIFPNYNPKDSLFNPTIEEDGSIWGQLTGRKDNKKHLIMKADGDYSDNLDSLPYGIKMSLGITYESILMKNDDLLSQLNEKNKKIRELNNVIGELGSFVETSKKELEQYATIDRKELKDIILNKQKRIEEIEGDLDLAEERKVLAKTESEKLKVELNRYKDEIDKYKKGQSNLTMLERSNERLKAEVDKFRELTRKSIIYNQEQIAEIESKNEEILKNLPLRERVKYIFKKYGFTVFAVVSAVGVVIGVIVSNLSRGLSTLGKGVGNGLKALGKKLGEILPGMVGAIVSFLFKTAGEVIGFLGKNAWLLIMAVVLYFVDRLKGGTSVKKRK